MNSESHHQDATSPSAFPFALPPRLDDKAATVLTATDTEFFELLAHSMSSQPSELQERLTEVRKQPGTKGQEAVERDIEIRRLEARLRLFSRFGVDLCLGRMVPDDGGAPVYVGRAGITDGQGGQLLLDWRTPAAEPFFGATRAEAQGLASRRRYRWRNGAIIDYWDEALSDAADASKLALDEESAFIASLGASRSPRMREVLGTIAADQDAIIRAESPGALVVDGGPGTGKTVVALHRAAYLLYSDEQLRRGGGVLFVGPNPAYLAYVDDVLPSLGEDGVMLATLNDLVPESVGTVDEADPEVASLKSSQILLEALNAAVASFERPPRTGLNVPTPWGDVEVGADIWADAFHAADPSLSHNEVRNHVWEALLDLTAEAAENEADAHRRFDDEYRGTDDYDSDGYGSFEDSEEDLDLEDLEEEQGYRGDVPLDVLKRALSSHAGLREAFARAWPSLDSRGLLADFYSNPAFLQRMAPTLTAAQVSLLQRQEPRAWTLQDVPLLDAAYRAVGDPSAAERNAERESAVAAERQVMERVVDDLIASDDGDGLMKQLRHADLQDTLLDSAALPSADPDALAGPFAHIIVDEAQELTPAQWSMLVSRCPARSFTIVGDRAQTRAGFSESWEVRLAAAGLPHTRVTSLSVNYRTPEEIMEVAAPVIRAEFPDANVPTSVRSSGIPVRYSTPNQLAEVLQQWLAKNQEGVACVISTPAFAAELGTNERVRSLTPLLAKGLEFDLVVLVNPSEFGTGLGGAVDTYVSMTRATRELVVLEGA